MSTLAVSRAVRSFFQNMTSEIFIKYVNRLIRGGLIGTAALNAIVLAIDEIPIDTSWKDSILKTFSKLKWLKAYYLFQKVRIGC